MRTLYLLAALAACDSTNRGDALVFDSLPSVIAVSTKPFMMLSASSAPQESDGTPELPRIRIDERTVPAAVRRVTAASTAELKRAIAMAKAGDEIVLVPGRTYSGPFDLPNRKDDGWVTIRSGGDVATQVPVGTRITPKAVTLLASLNSEIPTEPVIRTKAGAKGWRLQLLEVTARASDKQGYTMIALGSAEPFQNTLASVPSNLVLDRMYIHGTPTLDFQRCIGLNSGSTAIVDSWISDCHGRGYDSQAIAGWNGTGPYKIVNNYLEGAGENVMIGGADPLIPKMVPADIEIRRNHFFKPLSWQGVWTVKNSFELKLGRRVLIEGNVFENCWGDAQIGFGIVLKTTNQGGGAPWSETSDVTLRYNVLRNSAHGISLAGNPEDRPAVPMHRVYVGHNSLEQIGTGGGRFEGGRVFQIADVDDLTIESNSGAGPLNGFLFTSAQGRRLVIENNAVGLTAPRFGGYGQTLTSAEGKGVGKDALAFHAPGAVFRRNLLWGGNATTFAADNLFPVDPAAVGFTNFPANLELRTSSRYRGAGVDFPKLREMTAGVVVIP